MSEDLKWSSHINNITGKSNQTLGFLRRNLKQCPQQLKELSYIALVCSVADYCRPIWDPYLQKDITALEKVQHRAARFVKGDYKWDSSVTHMLEELGWQPSPIGEPKPGLP